MKLMRKKQHPARRSGSLAHEGRASNADLNERYTFRRNRTLTGSLASGVTSVNEHRAELKSARVHSHHLKHHRRRLFFALLAVIGVSALLVWAIYESIASVKVATLNGARLATGDAAMYERKIQDYLNGHFFERSRATLNTDNLAVYLQDNGCPEVKRVSEQTSFAGLGATTIRLEMRQPVISWNTGTNQLYVDNEGTSFQRNYFAAPAVAVVDQSGIQAKNNEVLASNSFLAFMGYTFKAFEQQGFAVNKVVLPANTTRQIQVSLENVAYTVKLTVDRPAGEQAEDAVRAIKYLSSKGYAAEYIDVRVSGKAFYK